jgi:hypothetical protein
MNRRKFLTLLAAGAGGLAVPRWATALGDSSNVTIARLQYADSGWNIRQSGPRRLLQEVEKRTSIAVNPDSPAVRPTDPDLFMHPLTCMCGEGSFEPLSEEGILKLRQYLTNGGFLWIDSADGVRDGPFTQSVERMMTRIFPDRSLGDVSQDHVLYKAFYLLDEPVGRLSVADSLRAIFGDDRLYSVICPNDMFGALSKDNLGNWSYTVRPGGEQQREMAFRLGINMVMYALCVNYKSDQVHVPFILKRRDWKVD